MDAYELNLVGTFALSLADIQRKAMLECGLETADMTALLAVYARPGSAIGDVAATTSLTHSGAVRAVDRLEAQSLLIRKQAPDRRVAALQCTERGEATANCLLTARKEAIGDVLGGLSAKGRAALVHTSKILLTKLTEDQTEAWRICRLCEHSICMGDDCPVGSGVRNRKLREDSK